MRRFERYVALGDSSTEGLDDPDGRGHYRGWANRLAEHIARAQGTLLYANLGVRGLRTRDIRERQLEPALAMRPDLVTLFAGTNDVVAKTFDPGAVGADMEAMHRALIGQGATLLTFTLPDLTPVLPLARRIAPRVLVLNHVIRQVSAGTGAVMVDFAAYPLASDPRLWSEDRFHANAEGHTRIAAALAHAAGVPGFEAEWADDLPPAPPPTAGSKVVAELRWVTRYLIPWLWRHAHGRSSGDGVKPKRPELEPMLP
jgi:lysophospholipase L1-like esterase